MCGEVRELIDLYVTGDLKANESLAVENHLAGCETCRREADSYRAHVGNLASLASQNQEDRLPPFFWQGIQKAILIGDVRGDTGEEGAQEEGGSQPSARPAFSRRSLVLAVAAAVLLVISLFHFSGLFGVADPGSETLGAPEREVVDSDKEPEKSLKGVPFFRPSRTRNIGSEPPVQSLEL